MPVRIPAWQAGPPLRTPALRRPGHGVKEMAYTRSIVPARTGNWLGLCSRAEMPERSQRKEKKVPMEEELKPSSRRSFLGGVTALTAASYNRVLGANDRVGVGFIGFGLIGKQHVADFKKFNDVDLVGLCDVYKPRVDEGLAYMGNPNAKGYSDFRKMYE